AICPPTSTVSGQMVSGTTVSGTTVNSRTTDGKTTAIIHRRMTQCLESFAFACLREPVTDDGAAHGPLTAAVELRKVGLRVTAARLAILETVRVRPHLGAEVIASLARDRVGSVSTQAVYEALNALTDAGLVRRIEPAGSP